MASDRPGRSALVNKALAITTRGKVAEIRARLLTRIVNRTLKANPSRLDRLATVIIVKVSGKPVPDPELDHEAWA